MNSEKYIGLDVHQATIVVAVMNSSGKLVMESILETKAATILQFFAGLRGTLSVTDADVNPSTYRNGAVGAWITWVLLVETGSMWPSKLDLAVVGLTS
jgi:hypothetical protein